MSLSHFLLSRANNIYLLPCCTTAPPYLKGLLGQRLASDPQ